MKFKVIKYLFSIIMLFLCIKAYVLWIKFSSLKIVIKRFSYTPILITLPQWMQVYFNIETQNYKLNYDLIKKQTFGKIFGKIFDVKAFRIYSIIFAFASAYIFSVLQTYSLNTDILNLSPEKLQTIWMKTLLRKWKHLYTSVPENFYKSFQDHIFSEQNGISSYYHFRKIQKGANLAFVEGAYINFRQKCLGFCLFI